MKKLVIIGGFGNGAIAASTVEDINTVKKEWAIIGFLNDYEAGPINGYPVVGKIDPASVREFLEDDNVYFLYTLFSVKLNYKFLHKLTGLKIPVERFATIVHPTAVVSKFSKIGYGVCIHPCVSVSPNVVLGNHVQVFAQSLIGHDSVLGDYSYVANNACVGAFNSLENGAYLGTNCCLIENVTIGEWALVGMGAVVLKDVSPYTKVVGNPAREIGKVG